MSLRIQIIIAAIIIIAFIYISNLVRKGRVELKYTITWYILGIIYLIFDLVPSFMNWVSKAVGIGTPSNFLLFLAVGIIFLILFSQTIVISRQTQNIKTLIQKNALLEKKIDDLLESEKDDRESL